MFVKRISFGTIFLSLYCGVLFAAAKDVNLSFEDCSKDVAERKADREADIARDTFSCNNKPPAATSPKGDWKCRSKVTDSLPQRCTAGPSGSNCVDICKKDEWVICERLYSITCPN
jgi:hypothetical protein